MSEEAKELLNKITEEELAKGNEEENWNNIVERLEQSLKEIEDKPKKDNISPTTWDLIKRKQEAQECGDMTNYERLNQMVKREARKT